MDIKIEEMIALGAAYAVNCMPCMEFHEQKAMKAGLTPEEMRAAIGIAEGVKAGASRKIREFANDRFGSVKTERCCPPGSECCP